MRKSLLSVISILAIFLGICTPKTLAQHADDEARCRALLTTDFSGIPDAPTQIGDARVVRDVRGLLGDAPPSADEFAKSLGTVQPACRVAGYVTPNAGFVLLLPLSHWNGKFLHVGCGGWCGSTLYQTTMCALYGEYACIGTDMGHTGEGGLWSRDNLQAQIDFGYRATHVATLAGKAILEKFYATGERKSYFIGCSTGGYQGMVEAQRFPYDFDGIVSGAPDMDENDLSVRGIWLQQNFHDKDGKPVLSKSDLQLIHDAALAKCDMDDGVKDGIISAPFACKFDPGGLECNAGKQTGCLTARQVEAVRNIYGQPRTSKGMPVSSRGVFPGSELYWAESFTDTWGEGFFKDTALLSPPGKEWKYADFDFDRDYKRSGVGLLYNDTNPDLRKFKAAGGKLLSYQGGNDTAEIPGAVFDYYETVEKTMGGREATQDFYRLFTIPGMNHCTGGAGVSAFDFLSYLEAWVERGQAPDKMIGAHIDGLSYIDGLKVKLPLDPSLKGAFTRPIYPYPLHAKYKGTGNPNDAANFEPTE